MKKYGLLKEAILFNENDRLKANGLIGNCPIIGIVPNLSIQIGNRVLIRMIGIVQNGEFDLLVGNYISREMDININVRGRSFTY